MEAVLESQDKLQALFLDKMDTFQGQLQLSPSTSKSTLADEFASFRTYILLALKSLQEQISLLARETDNQEMRARRKILLIHGVPESKNEITTAAVVKVVTEQLKISDFTAADINRCHRMGRSLVPDKTRPILLKLRDIDMRQLVWKSKKVLKGSGVTLSEFLTKTRHQTFMLARERFGLTKCWTQDGFVIISGPGDKRYRICSRLELDKIEMPAPNPSSVVTAAAATTTPHKLKKPDVGAEKKVPRVTRRVPIK